MNKLMGFFELNELDLPTIPWKQYDPSVQLNENTLWTIRSAVNRGDDLNLPRLIGKNAFEAKKFADDLYSKLGLGGIVIYYPYFNACKSGTLNVFVDRFIIEAVNKDLWNLVTNQDIEVSLSYNFEMNLIHKYGNENFISELELKALTSNLCVIRKKFRDELLVGKSVLLEWSFAYNSDINGKSIGDKYLVFYEIRTI